MFLSEILYLYNLNDGAYAKTIGVCKVQLKKGQLSMQIDVTVDEKQLQLDENKRTFIEIGNLKIGSDKTKEIVQKQQQSTVEASSKEQGNEQAEAVNEAEEEKTKEKKEQARQITDLFELKNINEQWDSFRQNTFLLHGFYNYGHVLVSKNLLGVPGNYYEREKQVAAMFGFDTFVLAKQINMTDDDFSQNDRTFQEGDYGYYVRRITESK